MHEESIKFLNVISEGVSILPTEIKKNSLNIINNISEEVTENILFNLLETVSKLKYLKPFNVVILNKQKYSGLIENIDVAVRFRSTAFNPVETLKDYFNLSSILNKIFKFNITYICIKCAGEIILNNADDVYKYLESQKGYKTVTLTVGYSIYAEDELERCFKAGIIRAIDQADEIISIEDILKWYQDLKNEMYSLYLDELETGAKAFSKRINDAIDALKLISKKALQIKLVFPHEVISKTFYFNFYCPRCNKYYEQEHLIIEQKSKTQEININKITFQDLDKHLLINARENIENEYQLKKIYNVIDAVNQIGLGYLTLDTTLESLSTNELKKIQLAKLFNNDIRDICYLLENISSGLIENEVKIIYKFIINKVKLNNTVFSLESNLNFNDADKYFVYKVENEKIVFKEEHNDTKTIERKVSKDSSLNLNNQNGLRSKNIEWITMNGLCLKNLKNIDLKIPLHKITNIIGPSGSGKSSAIKDTLAQFLIESLNQHNLEREVALKKKFNFINYSSSHKLNNIYLITDSSYLNNSFINLGRLTGATNEICKVLSQSVSAKLNNISYADIILKTNRYKCAHCFGKGILILNEYESSFCKYCEGNLYNKSIEILNYKNYSFFELYNLRIEELERIFRNISKVSLSLQILLKLGFANYSLFSSIESISLNKRQLLKLYPILLKSQRRDSIADHIFIFDNFISNFTVSESDLVLNLFYELRERHGTVINIDNTYYRQNFYNYLIEFGPNSGPSGGEIVNQCILN